MTRIMNFNSSALDELLKKFDLHKTWLSILATHLHKREDMSYIIHSLEYKNAEILEYDLIDGLSIGEISVLYEYSHAMKDADSRKSNGQFFTPDDVAKFMSEFSNRFPDGRWLDPCSGIGNLTLHLVAAQKDPESFLTEKMILSDRDDLALLIARTLLTLEFQHKRSRLFHDISNNFIVFDFLSVANRGRNELFRIEDDLDKIPAHDFVIVNPPYLATKNRDDRFETARSSDLYAYFLENIIKTSRGFISVTPQSFTNAGKFYELRSLLIKSYKNLTIFNFDNVPGNIFRGIKFGSRNSNKANSIRASIMIAVPGNGKPRITSLIRWRSTERELMFKESDKFLSDVRLRAEFFPKVNASLQTLYETLEGTPTLLSLTSSIPSEFPLFIPSSPRYFISALKTKVQRTSLQVIYFRSSTDRDRAYLLINSSLMYWWWRVRDGGMTLSKETLLTLPLPDFKIKKGLVHDLEDSENKNKVHKLNAGSIQENVKHSLNLIARLNEHIIPEYASRLLKTHNNSDLV